MMSYIKSGWQFNLSVAIDFTSLNCDPRQMTSLHYIGANNPYERVIRNVGKILEPYDSDNLIPVYGFGGVPPGASGVSQCFPLNGNSSNPEVKGLE
jgi:E3 ubiquitin-protein ligase RGLG